MIRLCVMLILMSTMVKASDEYNAFDDYGMKSPEGSLLLGYSMMPLQWSIRARSPDATFRTAAGLCLPQKDTENKLIYESNTRFSQNDLDAVTKPTIPNIDVIQSPSDIICIAKFYKDYSNYMTKGYVNTNKIMENCIERHHYAFEYETKRLLTLVRPQDASVNTSLLTRIQDLIKNVKDDHENALLYFFFGEKSFCTDASTKKKTLLFDISFCKFECVFWDGWYPDNKDLVNAVMKFATLIYKNKPDIQAYATEEDFNSDLIRIDPGFSVFQNLELNQDSGV